MNRMPYLLTTLAATALLIGTAQAQPPGLPEQALQVVPEELTLSMIDANGDGWVSSDELSAWDLPRKILTPEVRAAIDTNADGRLSDEEVANSGIPGTQGRSPIPEFVVVDTDGNNRISPEELRPFVNMLAPFRTMFYNWDINKDGSLSRGEFESRGNNRATNQPQPQGNPEVAPDRGNDPTQNPARNPGR